MIIFRYIQRAQVIDINALENWLPEDFNFEEHYHLTKGKLNNTDIKKRKIVSENENNTSDNNNKIKKTNNNNHTPHSNAPTKNTKNVVSTITPTTTSATTITSPIMSPEEKAILRERQLNAAENRKNNFQQSGILPNKNCIQKKAAHGASNNRPNQLMSPSMWD